MVRRVAAEQQALLGYRIPQYALPVGMSVASVETPTIPWYHDLWLRKHNNVRIRELLVQ